MNNDSKHILDDILSRWHHHCKHFTIVRQAGADPMFKMARSSRHWSTEEEVREAEIDGYLMKAVDFNVGEMENPHRAAIYMEARNCYTGRSVWLSPLLPRNKEERAIVIMEARNMLTRRLMAAGVM